MQKQKKWKLYKKESCWLSAGQELVAWKQRNESTSCKSLKRSLALMTTVLNSLSYFLFLIDRLTVWWFCHPYSVKRWEILQGCSGFPAAEELKGSSKLSLASVNKLITYIHTYN